MKYVRYSARTKAGRAWIAAILDGATAFYVQSYNGITGESSLEERRDLSLLRRLAEVDGKGLVIYEVKPLEYVFVGNGGGTGITRYVIRTYAFDVTDLPEVPPT